MIWVICHTYNSTAIGYDSEVVCTQAQIVPTHNSVLCNRPSLVSSHHGQSFGLLVNATFAGYVEVKTPLHFPSLVNVTFAGNVEARLVHFPSLMALRSISGVVLVVLVEVRGDEETVGRRRGHQSASSWRSLQHQRGASGGCGLVQSRGGCGLVQSRGGCGLRSMLCSLLLWCVIDTVVAAYMYMYVYDCGRFVFETGWLSVAMPILLIDTVVAVYMYMTGWLSVTMPILSLPPCRCLSAAPPGGGAALLLSTHTLTPSPLWTPVRG